jgi:uncharacterized protein with PQ loop repeat
MLVWIGTAVAVLATLPQLVRALQTWSVQDLDGTSIALALFSNCLFFVHSLSTKDWAYATLAAWFLVYGLTLSYIKFTSESRDFPRA